MHECMELCINHTKKAVKFNPLKPSGNYMSRVSSQFVRLYFVFMGFVWFLLLTAIISLNSVNQLIFAMVKFGVLFEVWPEFLYTI
jgi:hypothetical protein